MADLGTAQRCAEELLANDRASRMLGITVEVTEIGQATATMTVRDDMVNGLDVCHGGLVFAFADTAFACACNAYDMATVAASGKIEFIRPALLGDRLVAAAQEDYRGRRNGFYSVRVTNQQEQLVALFHGRAVGTGESLLQPAK